MSEDRVEEVTTDHPEATQASAPDVQQGALPPQWPPPDMSEAQLQERAAMIEQEVVAMLQTTPQLDGLVQVIASCLHVARFLRRALSIMAQNRWSNPVDCRLAMNILWEFAGSLSDRAPLAATAGLESLNERLIPFMVMIRQQEVAHTQQLTQEKLTAEAVRMGASVPLGLPILQTGLLDVPRRSVVVLHGAKPLLEACYAMIAATAARHTPAQRIWALDPRHGGDLLWQDVVLTPTPDMDWGLPLRKMLDKMSRWRGHLGAANRDLGSYPDVLLIEDLGDHALRDDTLRMLGGVARELNLVVVAGRQCTSLPEALPADRPNAWHRPVHLSGAEATGAACVADNTPEVPLPGDWLKFPSRLILE